MSVYWSSPLADRRPLETAYDVGRLTHARHPLPYCSGIVVQDERLLALREVREETGYADLEIVTDLGEQDAESDSPDGHVIRREHYFLMRLSSERQVRRTTDDISFTPESVSWGGAVQDVAFDKERRWLFAARGWLIDQDEETP